MQHLLGFAFVESDRCRRRPRPQSLDQSVAFRRRRVSLQAGTYKLGPDDGTLSVQTGRTGAAAKAGHDLLIVVTAWEATLAVGDDPADTSIELAADAASLRVREGKGGMQSLGDDDKANIQQTIDDDVLKRQAITFRSTVCRSIVSCATASAAPISVSNASRSC